MHRSAPQRKGRNHHSPDQIGHGDDCPRVTLRLSAELAKRLEGYCRKHGCTRSDALTTALWLLIGY